MKRYKIDDVNFLDLERIEAAIITASKHKMHRKTVQKVLRNKKLYAKKIRYMLEYNRFIPQTMEPFVIKDGLSKKERTIDSAPFFPDQVIHTHIIELMKPKILQGMYEFCCACVPGRGMHYGKKFMEKWLKEKKKKYIVKLDVKKYYPNLKPDVVWEAVRKRFKPSRTIEVLKHIIYAYDYLPIGLLTSQWLANFVLQDFDHYIKEKLKVKHYMRYMDDLVLIDGNKRKLRKACFEIEKYMENMGLIIKPAWCVHRFDYKDRTEKRRGKLLDFMGFKFYHDHTTIRSTLFLKIRRRIIKASKKDKLSVKQAAGIISSIGWLKHTDSKGFYKKYLTGKMRIKNLKKVVKDDACRKQYKAGHF